MSPTAHKSAIDDVSVELLVLPMITETPYYTGTPVFLATDGEPVCKCWCYGVCRGVPGNLQPQGLCQADTRYSKYPELKFSLNCLYIGVISLPSLFPSNLYDVIPRNLNRGLIFGFSTIFKFALKN